jgi:C_GCAxxG_C_C family probable redox protein
LKFEDQAKRLFEAHYNCAQSTFGAFAEHFNLDLTTAVKIAMPFGGGIGHSGGMCGAVSGGIMVIGLARGIDVYDKDKKEACYALAREFLNRFSALHGSLTCPGLLGVDIGDPLAQQDARERGLFRAVCTQLVVDAARLAAEVLELDQDEG